jgi:hypothetical protein
MASQVLGGQLMPDHHKPKPGKGWLDTIEDWTVRIAVAIGIGVVFGLFLVWLKGQL